MGLSQYFGTVALMCVPPGLGWIISTFIRPGQLSRSVMATVGVMFTVVAAACAFAVIWISSSLATKAHPGLKLLPVAFFALFGLWLAHNLRRIKVYALMAKRFPNAVTPVNCSVPWIEDLMRDITRAWQTDILTIMRHTDMFTVRLSIGGRTIATVSLPYLVDSFFTMLGEHHLHLEPWPADGATIAHVRMLWMPDDSTWTMETVRFPTTPDAH